MSIINNESPISDLTSQDIIEYYSERALEFEEIYSKKVDHNAISSLQEFLSDILHNRDCLEIACGTGFWTERIAPLCKSIVAVDINSKVIEIAKRKVGHSQNVSFIKIDAYDLSNLPRNFTSGLAAFWISHVPKEKIDSFLINFHKKLKPNSVVVLIDNKYIKGHSQIPIYYDSFGNSYQTRVLQSGKKYDILKNYYSYDDIKVVLKNKVKYLMFGDFGSYWCVCYRPT